MKQRIKKLRDRWHSDIKEEIGELAEVKSLCEKVLEAGKDERMDGYKFIELLMKYEAVIGRDCLIINQYLAKKGYTLGLFEDTSMKEYEHNPIVFKNNDQIRVGSMELAANEIYDKGIPGATAELGVWQGVFSEAINLLFPDRKLYLFDTFEGLDERDVQHDKADGLTGAVSGLMGDTSVEQVLKRMKYKGNCIVKKGYFPDTAEGLEEEFCFVNIDCDLYLPIYEGLRYFYPRLVKGGYIFVHDYLFDFYGGAKKAVRQFSEESGVPYFVLPDAGTSAVFMK